MRSKEPPVTGAVWQVLDAWAARQAKADPFGRRPTQLEMAKAFGVGKSLITHWKLMTSRMQVSEMVRIASQTDIKYADLSAALAEDEPMLAANAAKRSSLEAKIGDYIGGGDDKGDMRERG